MGFGPKYDDFPPPEPGVYLAQFTDLEISEARTGREVFILSWELMTDNEHDGLKLREWVTLMGMPDDEDAEFGLEKMLGIMYTVKAEGVEEITSAHWFYNDSNRRRLHKMLKGKRIGLRLIQKPSEKDPSKIYANIGSHMPYDKAKGLVGKGPIITEDLIEAEEGLDDIPF